MIASHPIEHTVGIYIGLLLLACVVGIVSKLLTKLPYTVFLTVVGLLIGIFNFGPEISETGFGYELIFFVFLPPLLFQGGFHILNSPGLEDLKKFDLMNDPHEQISMEMNKELKQQYLEFRHYRYHYFPSTQMSY